MVRPPKRPDLLTQFFGLNALCRTRLRVAYVLEAGPFTGCSGCVKSARH